MTTPEAQPAAPEPQRPWFQFSLRTLLLLFLVLGSSLAVFGAVGIEIFLVSVVLAVYLNRTRSFRLLFLFVFPLFLWIIIYVHHFFGVFTTLLLPTFATLGQNGWRLNWPNIAALAAWMLSVGVLLTHAVRSRKVLSVTPPPS